jgi:anthranilate synthase component 2
MKALLIDAYDSFVFIIRQYLLALDIEPVVVRNDKLSLRQIEDLSPDFILLGPGPGHPADAHYVEVIDAYGGRLPILGVCLGHQAIGLAFGGTVLKADHLMHGKTSRIEHDGGGCFAGQDNPFRATRYHSLIVDEATLPACLEVSARSLDDGYVMGLRHRTLPIESVQFHPESIYTESGLRLFENFVSAHAGRPKRPSAGTAAAAAE